MGKKQKYYEIKVYSKDGKERKENNNKIKVYSKDGKERNNNEMNKVRRLKRK